jgi:hypothetical protein
MIRAAWMLLLLPPLVVQGMECKGETIAPGIGRDVVEARCGRSDYTERWSTDVAESDGNGATVSVRRRFEVMTYNRGSREPIMRIVVVDGAVTEVERLGLGVRDIGRTCQDSLLRPGTRTGEVFLHCGAPDQRIVRIDDTGGGDDGAAERSVQIEEWQYRLPGSSQLRVVYFREGRLERVERTRR